MKKIFYFIICILILCSCTQGNRDFSNHGTQLPTQPLSFATASTYYYNLPAGNSNVKLTLPIYLTNNSSVNISGVAVAESNVVSYINSGNIDSSVCANIAAGKYCKFNLTISLESGIYNGSVILSASYIINSKSYNMSSIISFNTTNGVMQVAPVYDKSILSSASPKEDTYVELFYLAHGESTENYELNYANDSYTVVDANVANGGKIHGGDVVSMLLKVNPVAAATSLASQNTYALNNLQASISGVVATLTNESGTVYSISENVNTPQSAANVNYGVPYIVSGSPSIITTQTQESIVINYINLGNANATIGNFIYNTNLLNIVENGCPTDLAPLQTCSVLFETLATNGSDNILLNYSESSQVASFSTVSSVNWYYDLSQPIIVPTIQNIIGIATNVSSTAAVSVMNLGAQLNNITYSAKYDNPNGSVTLFGQDNCSSLASGASCQFGVLLFSKKSSNNTLTINGVGKSGALLESYNFALSANVVSSASGSGTAALSAESPVYGLAIIDNNYDSQSELITYRNNGTSSVTVKSVELDYAAANVPESWIHVINNNCNNSQLSPNDTCTVVVKLGPVIFPRTNMEALGTIHLDAIYTGAGKVNTATTLINYQIGATIYNVYLESVIAVNSESGTGLLTEPYVFAGVNNNLLNPQQIITTYRNNGTDPALVKNIQSYINPAFWRVTDNCLGKTLDAPTGDPNQQTCTIIYTNALYAIISVIPIMNRDFSFNLPTLIVQDVFSKELTAVNSTYFGQNAINVYESIALLTNSATVDTLGNVVLTQTFESYAGYPPVTFMVQGDPFFKGFVSSDLPSYVNCEYDVSMGNVTQACTFDPNDMSLSGYPPIVFSNTYNVYPVGGCLSIYFSESAENAVIGSSNISDNSICFVM